MITRSQATHTQRDLHGSTPAPRLDPDLAYVESDLRSTFGLLGVGNGTDRRALVPPGTGGALIAASQGIVRVGLRSILMAQGSWQLIDEAGDGQEAIRKALKMKPRIAIVDSALRGVDGVETTRQIRTRSPETEVLALTPEDNHRLVLEFIRVGVRAVVLKSDDEGQILAAIDALAARKSFFSTSLSTRLIDMFHASARFDDADLLRPRQRSIVKLIAEGHSSKAIARILNLSSKTVEAHRGAAMRAVGAKSTAELIRYAIRAEIIEA